MVTAPLLDGELVRLEPLGHRHAADLAAAAEEDRSSYRFTWVPTAGEVGDYIDAQLARAAAGSLMPQTAPRTVADGLLTSLGDLTWPVIRDQVEQVVTVSEEEIVAAMRLAWERAKLLIEPSAAVAVAAVLSDNVRALSGLARVGVVLSGGNVNLDQLPW